MYKYKEYYSKANSFRKNQFPKVWKVLKNVLAFVGGVYLFQFYSRKRNY